MTRLEIFGQEPLGSLTSLQLLLLSLSTSDWSQESHSQRLVQPEQLERFRPRVA